MPATEKNKTRLNDKKDQLVYKDNFKILIRIVNRIPDRGSIDEKESKSLLYFERDKVLPVFFNFIKKFFFGWNGISSHLSQLKFFVIMKCS